MRLTIALLAVTLLPACATAQHWDLQTNQPVFRETYSEHGRSYRIYNYRPRSYRKPEVRGYIHRRPDETEHHEPLTPVIRCFEAQQSLGDQHISIEGAKSEAIKGWTQDVRYYHGERAMDFNMARHASFACGRSSVGSVAGQVLHRCKLVATPCTPPNEKADK